MMTGTYVWPKTLSRILILQTGASRGICSYRRKGPLSRGWYAEGAWNGTSASGLRSDPPASTRRSSLTFAGLPRSLHTSSQKPDAKITGGQLQHCQVEIQGTGKAIELTQVNGESSRFNATWLRYNCHCSQCKQEHSGQKLFKPTSLQFSYSIKNTSVSDGIVTLEWLEDPDHHGIVPVEYLIENDYSLRKRKGHSQSRDVELYQNGFPEIAYEDVLKSRTGLLRWLLDLNKYGMCLLRGVPTVAEKVKEIAELIWPVQDTIYEKVFDVKSEPNPINIAYTDVELPYHMDLMYYESPPGLQLLHCLRFDSCVVGGESLFVDVFDVAEELRQQHPNYFQTLCQVPATFQKIHYDRDVPVYMKYQRPHIVLNPEGVVTAVNWSPAFEGPLLVEEELVEPYYKAYNVFAKMIEKSRTKKEIRLLEGDLISFNNRRILHARNKFTLNGGVRHLQGAYVNIDHFKNQVEVLSRTVGDGQPAKRVGNHDYF